MSSKLIKIQIEKTHLIFKRVSTKPKARREKVERKQKKGPPELNRCVVVYTLLTTEQKMS